MSRALLSEQAGQASVELAGSLWVVLLAALTAWQLALAGWTAVGTANAARTAARAYSRTGDSSSAITDGHQSLSGYALDKDSEVRFSGGTATVRARIPLLLPGLSSPLHVTATADMPFTG